MHSTLSHGKVFSKFTPLTIGFLELSSLITGDLGDIVISLISIVILFLATDSFIGSILGIGIILQMLIITLLRRKISKEFKPIDIQRRDASTEASTVLVTQKSFIRTVFATESMLNKYRKAFSEVIVSIRTSQMTYKALGSLIEITNTLTTVIVISLLFMSDKESLTILALVASLGRNDYMIGQTGKVIGNITTEWIDLTDSWEFMKENSKTTYPVLDS
ncbi:MAG: hypothetical protein AAGF07_04980 [Patescibacteria group bacterium]